MTDQDDLGPDEILSQETLRSEVNSLVLPFFALSRHEVNTRARTEYSAVIRRGGERLEVYWKVAAHQDFGYPGPFDRQVYRAIEQILGERRPPLQNPVRLGSLNRIALLMGMPDAGWVYDDIRQALHRIIATTVESRGAYYSKAGKHWVEDMFHLYDRVAFKGDPLPEGRIADSTYLFVGSWLLDNLNARYMRPLDYDYYRSLRSPIASRLYELLGVKFYGMGRFPSIRYRYSTVCELLPVSRYQYLSKAKEKLEPAHRELLASGFLAQVEWAEAEGPDGEDWRDWYITYWPGGRAGREQQLAAVLEGRDEGYDQQDLRFAPVAPEDGRPVGKPTAGVVAALQGVLQQYGDAEVGAAALEPPLSREQRSLADQLEKRGVSYVTARELVTEKSGDQIRAWLDAVSGKPDIADVGAYLTRAIREDWQPPAQGKFEGAAAQEVERAPCRICEGRNFYWTDGADGRRVARCDHQRRRRPRRAKEPVAETAWPAVLERLQGQMTRAAFESRLKTARFLGFDGPWAVVAVANDALRQGVQNGVYQALTRAFQDVTGREKVQVEVVVAE